MRNAAIVFAQQEPRACGLFGNVRPLRMNRVDALVIGRTDERLNRLAEVHRMLGTHMQIEVSPRVVAFDQLEMVGDVEP